jgi:hypothetical protein
MRAQRHGCWPRHPSVTVLGVTEKLWLVSRGTNRRGGSRQEASKSERFQCRLEREGLPPRSQKPNKIRHFLQARGHRVYQSCAPKSMGSLHPFRTVLITASIAIPVNAAISVREHFPSACLPAPLPARLSALPFAHRPYTRRSTYSFGKTTGALLCRRSRGL